MKLNITITQEHIAKATSFSKCNYPIANAINQELRETHPELWNPLGNKSYSIVSVDQDKGRIHLLHSSKIDFTFKLPKVAEQFIRDRDDRKEVGPFSFEINAIAA